MRKRFDWLTESKPVTDRLCPPLLWKKRILLSGTPVIDVVGGVATITAGTCADDGNDDVFELESNGSGPNPMYRVTLNGGTAVNIGRADDISQIKINGSADKDRFEIQQNTIPINGLIIDGKGSVANDEVILMEPIALVGSDPSFDQINFEVADTSSTVSFVKQGSPMLR